jgi:hypothetical protein
MESMIGALVNVIHAVVFPQIEENKVQCIYKALVVLLDYLHVSGTVVWPAAVINFAPISGPTEIGPVPQLTPQ